MGPKSSASATLFVVLNLLFTLVTSCGTCSTPTPNPTPTPSPSNPTNPTPTPSPSSKGKCPKDALKLGVCADVLGLVNVVIGKPPKMPCCSLLNGLIDLEAAVCLCTAIKANVLGLNLNIPVDLSLILNYCGKKVPAGFKCT
ncbi:hypothetical protein QJS04_geneDACA012392 [Acorus gramineus]|uniref:Bifunctional inhibitor/plant lipid transfer protein/seed storage helical domain-containing protein n=1 Tax=Acorus gramineus TaxID=55184 RepID=A0AAV9B9R2_ACOGR|nr:hypothetical protein QJS04_geneDACA012392 [Acorus gramineus]